VALIKNQQLEGVRWVTSRVMARKKKNGLNPKGSKIKKGQTMRY